MPYNPDAVFDRALAWMRGRNWNRKIAKSATGQTLLEHTLIELDVFLAIESILTNERALALTEAERSIVLASLLCHDVGKETDAWQKYVKGMSEGRVPHIDSDMLRHIAPEVCGVLEIDGLDTEVERTVELCARYHHSRPGRDDATILEAMLDAGKSFLALAHIVMDIDRLCSAETAQAAVDHLRRCDLGKHIAVQLHQINVRGVSSAFLHRAAQDAFRESGWRPLIYFVDSTVYFADHRANSALPDASIIQGSLKRVLGSCIDREVSSLIVGNPTGNMLPKPDLVSWNEIRSYLEEAGRRSNPLSFAKKKRDERERVVRSYLQIIGDSGPLDDGTLELQSQRISRAQPEMVVFKLFKALMDPNKVPKIDRTASTNARRLYDGVFGDGTWDRLQSTSTLMPAKDMAATIDPYWHLDASVIGRASGILIETLPDADRMAGLTELLDRIIGSVVLAVGALSPKDELPEKMSSAFLSDLIQPQASDDSNPTKIASDQAMHYVRSKPGAGSETNSGSYMCPVCNSAFESGRTASADFIDNPQGHTNRGVSHGTFGYVVVCNVCYYERLLRHLLMGARPQEVITLMPPWNVGPRNGEGIVAGVREMVDQASREMRGDTGDFSTGFSFGLTEQIAEQMTQITDKDARGARVAKLFRYRFSEKTKRARRTEAEKTIKNEYAEDLDLLNGACGTGYESWEAAIEAICAPGELSADLNKVRNEVLKIFPAMSLVCETPNLIFIPLARAIGSDESDANRALRSLFTSLLLHRAFDATVAIHSDPQEIGMLIASGAAWVPPVPAIRALLHCDWVPADEVDTWLDRIASAARLSQATGFPRRSAIFQTLVADPAEMIIRRIEHVGQTVSMEQALMIRQLPFFRTANLYEEV